MKFVKFVKTFKIDENVFITFDLNIIRPKSLVTLVKKAKKQNFWNAFHALLVIKLNIKALLQH